MRSGKRWQAAVLATASLLCGAGCTPTGDKPNESTDSAGPETNPTVVAPADPAIANHFATMFEVGPDADARYQESLEQLRTVPGATENLISRYKALGDANPSERWQVVETLRALADPAALKFLVPLARSPAPVDEGVEEGGRHGIEVIIRATATDAVAAIAKQRNGEAEQALLELLKSPEITVRRRAVRGYLDLGNVQERQKRLMSLLPRADHDLIAITPTEVRSVETPKVPLQVRRKNDADHSAPPNIGQRRQ